MTYLLDTNICIHFLRGMFNLDKKIDEIGIENCVISEITFAELVYGAENSPNTDKNLVVVEQFVEEITVLPIFEAIYQYAKEKTRLRKLGLMISDFDLFIGCTAKEHNLIMVTENEREFRRISGIEIENWISR